MLRLTAWLAGDSPLSLRHLEPQPGLPTATETADAELRGVRVHERAIHAEVPRELRSRNELRPGSALLAQQFNDAPGDSVDRVRVQPDRLRPGSIGAHSA